jgi:hypothetical protein
MSTATIQHLTQDVKAAFIAKQKKSYRPLNEETRSVIPTDAAAFHCNRQPQTLRAWACHENGPIRPIRINGRLAWPVDQICVLLQKRDVP